MANSSSEYAQDSQAASIGNLATLELVDQPRRLTDGQLPDIVHAELLAGELQCIQSAAPSHRSDRRDLLGRRSTGSTIGRDRFV